MLRHGVIAESIIFKCKSSILCIVTYCAAFNLNLFQSVLNVSENSLVFFLSTPYSSVLVLCCVLNTDFCIAHRSFCSATTFHRTSWMSETGLIDICLGDPNSQGMYGNERKINPILVCSVVMCLLYTSSTALQLLCAPWTGLGSRRKCVSTYSHSFYGLFILWLYWENKSTTDISCTWPKSLTVYNTYMIFLPPCSFLS